MVIRFQLIKSEIAITDRVILSNCDRYILLPQIIIVVLIRNIIKFLLAHHGFLQRLFIQSARQVPPDNKVRQNLLS